MPDHPPDTLVIYDGQEMTWAQFQAIVDKKVADFTQQVTTSIDEINGLENQMYDHATSAWDARYQLEADMNGIEPAFGTDDNGKNWLNSWSQSWPVIDQLMYAVWMSLGNYGQNLHLTADAFFQNEQQNLNQINGLGFNFQAIDPRPKPPTTGRHPLGGIGGPHPI